MNSETPNEENEHSLACKQCGGPVTIHKSKITNRLDSTFCCDDHRREWRTNNPLKSFMGMPVQQNNAAPSATVKEVTPKPVTVTLPNGLDATSQFIIGMITRDRDRFEEMYKTERDNRKKLRDDKDRVEKEFEKFKYDQQIDKIANAKPTGLDGLGENPLVNKLLDFVGPALGKLAERMIEPGATQQLAGNEQSPALSFATWLGSKTPETQKYVVEMLAALSQVPDENILIQKVAQIQNLVLGEYMRATG